MLKIFFRFRVEGKHNIPQEGSFIAASNHVSYLDPAVLGSSIPKILHFMAKEELFNIKFFGSFLRKVAAYPVRRDYRDFGAIKESLKILKKGDSIGLFPEGGRMSGPEFGEPYLGIGMLAAHSGVPVLPIYIKGTGKILSKTAKFGGFKSVTAYIGEPMRFDEGSEGNLEKKDLYREFSNKVMEHIANLKERAYGADN